MFLLALINCSLHLISSDLFNNMHIFSLFENKNLIYIDIDINITYEILFLATLSPQR